MLSRYYDFLAGLFAKWFKDENVPSGTRYQLTMDSQDEVDSLFSAISNISEGTNYLVGTFDARPELDFRTPLLKINQKQILLVKNDDDISLDFLVTLRNRIADQKDIWHGKSIVFISSKVLDSILGGAMDISSDGGPFSSTKLLSKLRRSIDASDMPSFEKVVLGVAADSFDNSDVDLKLMDFADIYGIVEQGSINESDYRNIGLFPDKSLESINDSGAQKKRVISNRAVFEKIGDFHTMPGAKEEIETYLPDLSGVSVNQLADDNTWMSTDFNPVLKALDKKKHPGATAKFIDDDFYKQQTGSIPIWHRLDGDSKAKSRNHNIIAFIGNSNEVANFDIVLPFDATVAKKDFTSTYFGGKANMAFFSERNSGKKHILTVTMPSEKFVLGIKLVFRQMNVATSKQTFKIVVVRSAQSAFQQVKSQYLINVKKSQIDLQILDTQNDISFSTGTTVVKSIHSHSDLSDNVSVDDGFEYDFSHYEFEDSEIINFDLRIGNDAIHVELAGEQVKVVPGDPNQIDIDRRTIMEPITFDTVKQLSVRDRAVYTREEHRKYLSLEQQVIASPNFCVQKIGDNIIDVEMELPSDIIDAISKVRDAVQECQTLPSLANLSGANDGSQLLRTVFQNYVDTVESQLDSFDEDAMISAAQQNIARLGTVERGSELDYSPIAPMNLAYLLETEKQIDNESVPYNVNKQLTSERLVPFIQRNDLALAASTNDNAPHWVMYHSISRTGTESAISDLVANRTQDFISNFSYMFKVNPQFALHVAVRNIVDHHYVFLGIVNALIRQINDGIGRSNFSLDNIRPVELYFDEAGKDYTSATNNQLIRNFFATGSLDYLTEIGADKIASSVINVYSKRDVLLALQKNIKVINGINSEIDYHITFYQFEKHNHPDVIPSDNLEMNTELGGILSSHEYTELQGWGFGFGTRNNTQVNNSPITSFAAKWNALVAATRQKNGSFRSGMSVFNSEDKLNDSSLNEIFSTSDWVTFIEPRLNVDVFNRLDDLYVIHYTDHDVTSNIDSITVTRRVDRYNQIVRETIVKQTQKYDNFPVPNPDDMGEVITSFNLLNGVWLLEILNDRMKNENRTREKLSIIAAYKLVIGLLDTSDTVWVPISLEEILRISGGSKLRKRDSILDGSELQKLDSANDDLLFMGVQIAENQRIIVHVVPAEIKIGGNAAGIISKAKTQVLATLHYLNNELVKGNKFENDVARNFFIKLYVANLRKLISSNEFTLKNYSQVLSVIDRLKNNQAEFVTGVPDKYGEGFIVNFGKDNLYRGLRKLDGDQEFGITEIRVPESDGYTVPLKSLVEAVEAVKNGSAGFDIDGILDSEPAGSDKQEPWLKMHIREKTAESIVNEPAQYADTLNDSEEKVAENTDLSATEVDGETSEHAEMIAEYEQNDKKKTFDGASDQANLDVAEKSTDHELSEVRLPLGYAEGSSQIINWEYGNSNLANRHMLVSGKSGQGKTYFLQGLILEMAKKHISTLVIDYTKSYALPQLDAEFKEKMTGKIKQEIVYQDGIALNPFKLGKVDLGLGEPITESPSDMIERVAQTFDFVFNLGIQQRSQLIDAITEEYETYHEDLTFEQLGEHLKADKDAKTLYGRIRALLKPGIFNIKADPIDWDRVFNDEGKMTVIQLTGHQHDIQSAITEFVLWNLFQFSLNSSEKVAKPIFLDEIQNLDFGNESPTVKILREGRKFGLSGIFATQSLSSVHGQGADSIWNAAVQIHFLPPEDQMQALSKAITSRPVERPDIESKIRALKKGHALLHGPILGEDGLVQTNEEISIIQMNDR